MILFNKFIDSAIRLCFGWCGISVQKWNFFASSILFAVFSLVSIVIFVALIFHLCKQIVFGNDHEFYLKYICGILILASFSYINWRIRLVSKGYIDQDRGDGFA